MNPAIVVPDQPNATASQLQTTLLRLVDQLNDGATAVLVPGVALLSGANKLRHGLQRGGRDIAPRSASFVPRANVAWWQDTQPDSRFIYITTAGAVTGDLQIWI